MKNNINNSDNDSNMANKNVDIGKDIMGVKNLYFKYRRSDDYIIREASFSIKEGMLYGMVGRNSTGKSTLLKLLCGREDKHGGEITLNNHTDIIYIKKNVGIISEEQKLFKELTIYENGVMHEKSYEGFKIEEFLDCINMYNINRNDRIDALSASDKIKVKISLVLARHVKVILLDEPTGVLDVSAREDFMRLLRDITIERNIAVIMATHLTDDLDKKADYIIFVNEDGTVEVDDREELNDKYMLLKGRTEDIKALPREAILSYEEKETSATAMTTCFNSIRDKVEGMDIVTETPDISAVMYYKDKENPDRSKTEKNMQSSKIRMERAKSKINTYKDIKRIYHGLFSLYGIRWGLAAFSIFLCVGWNFIILFDGDNAFEWYNALFLTICVDMFIEIMYKPKIIEKKEMYSEIKYLPVKITDVFKYIFVKAALGGVILLLLTGLMCVTGYSRSNEEALLATVIAYIIAVIFQTASAAFELKNA